MYMKILWHCILLATTCFSLMGYCPGSEGYCLTLHDDTKERHEVTIRSSLPDVHESHHRDSSTQCCRIPSQKSSDCARIFVFPSKTKSFRNIMPVIIWAQIPNNGFQISEKNFISEIFNSTNPTLASLCTVILQV